MPYWRLFYHIVWATEGRLALLTPQIEATLYPVLVSKSNAQGGRVYAVNGMPDHVHIVAAVPPALALADFVKKLKGSSSRIVRTEFQVEFAWQTGYGVFSVSERLLEQAVTYVQQQKEHHRNGTTISRLEYCAPEDEGPFEQETHR
jgi:REP element-mobilizing transposase RayT